MSFLIDTDLLSRPEQAPLAHQPSLRAWLAELRRKLAPATEPVTEPVLVRWKALLAELKRQRRPMTCEKSLMAATALSHGHTVATGNTRHFEASGVPVLNPLEQG